jgi:ABC-type transport system substrate-binding protein
MPAFSRWLLVIGFFLVSPAVIDRGLGVSAAQPPAKGKTPPSKEEEDPAAKTKPVKPPPSLEDTPKPEGPGETPPPGVLVVGVRSLPEFMSPQFARGDSERFALDLLFEGLLRPGTDGASGRVYEPGLARDLPTVVPLGRAFTLTDSRWSDGAPVTAADVAGTVEKLKKHHGQPGAEAAEWIVSVSTDVPNRCQISLSRGHIDPLSLMSFKVLPASAKDDIAFARKPVGSGPFVYEGRKSMKGREYAIFPANPAYRRPNPPRLSAVWMVLSRNPAADFKSRLFHFALTTHTGELTALASRSRQPQENPAVTDGTGSPAGKLEVNIENAGRIDTVFGRRVYFLAVNHQVPQLGEGEAGRDVRRCIAHAIRRDAILNACFRAGFTEQHQPLTGPFPPGTWPCSPLAGRLDDPDLAARDRKPGLPPVVLKLKYPDGDPAAAEACKLIAAQVAEVKAGITLKPMSVTAADYYRQVFENRDFDLAYWSYDYRDDWFRPAGLLERSTADPRNFTHYVPPGEVQQLLLQCQDRRQFGAVREAMQRLHLTFATEMPFIPLWHLDTHALLAAGLTTVPPAAQLDPLAPFTHIEQWTVR